MDACCPHASCGLYLFNQKRISKVSLSPSYYGGSRVHQGIFFNLSIRISCKIKIKLKISKSHEFENLKELKLCN